MVSRRKDKLLHKISHHTNVTMPHSDYVTGSKYPEQNQDILGTTITLRYRTMYRFRNTHDNDDSPDKYELTDIIEGEFIVVRFDIEEPKKIIAISRDYKVILVGDSDNYENQILEYPIQLQELIGLYVIDDYFEKPDRIQVKSVVLSCDNGEPCHTVIAEFYSDTRYQNAVRFILGDEVRSIVLEKYDPDGLRDYNGIDALNHGLVYIDLNGKFAGNEGELITVDADAGHADPLEDLYRRDILSLPEIIQLRRRILIERRIYGDKDINVRDIELDDSFLTINMGETHQLHATILPEDATNKNIIWSSSNDELCTVDDNGLVTPIHGGLVSICATTEDGGYKAYCRFKIIVPVTGVTIGNHPSSINVGETYQLEATILPEDATNKNVIWESSNSEVLNVSYNGFITCLSEGSATITVTTVDGDFTDSVNIECIQPTYDVTGFDLKAASHRYGDDNHILVPSTEETYRDHIVYRIFPENATNTKVYWTSSDNIELIGLEEDAGGLYTDFGSIGHLPGFKINDYYSDGTITGRTDDGNFTETINIYARNAITSINIQNIGTIKKNSSGLIFARTTREFNSYDCTKTGITWESSDPDVLTITPIPYEEGDIGVFKARYQTSNNYGNVTITVTTEDDFYGVCTDTYVVHIDAGFIPAQSIIITEPEEDRINLSTNNTKGYPNSIIVKAKVEPEDASVQKIEARIEDNWVNEACQVTKIATNTFRIDALKFDGTYGSKLVLSVDDSAYGGSVVTNNMNVYVTDYITNISCDNSIYIEPYGGQSDFDIHLSPETGAYVKFNSSDIVEDYTVSFDNIGLASVVNPNQVEYEESGFNDLKFKLVGNHPGTGRVTVSTVDKDGIPINCVSNLTVGESPRVITINDRGTDWLNLEPGTTVQVEINVTPSYYETYGNITLESSNTDLITITGQPGNNKFFIKIMNKGFDVDLIASVVDLVNPGITHRATKHINQVGTHHYATKISISGSAANGYYFPVTTEYNHNEVYATVDGEVGDLVYELLDDGVPFNVNETTAIGPGPTYYSYTLIPSVNEFSNYGTSGLLIRAVDPDPSIGDVSVIIPIKWGNPITSISIDEDISDITKDALYGSDFPITGNMKINAMVENPIYPATIKTCSWESSETENITINGDSFQTTYTSLKPGASTITATSTDGEYTVSTEVNVYGIMFETHHISIYQRDEYQLTPIFHLPDSFSTKNLEFGIKPGEPNIADVTIDGYVTGIDIGSTVITVTDAETQRYYDEIYLTVMVKENPLATLMAENQGSAYTYTNIDYGDTFDPTRQFSIHDIVLHVIGEDNRIPCTYPMEDIETTTDNYVKNPRYTGHIAEFDHYGDLYDIEKHNIFFNLYKPGITIFNVNANTGWYVTSGQIIIYGFRFDEPSKDLVIDDIVDLHDISYGYVPNDAGSLKFITYDMDSGQSVNTDIIDVVHSGNEYVITDGIINAKKEGYIYIKGYYTNRPQSYDIMRINITKNPFRRCVDIEIYHNYPDEQDKFYIKDQNDIRTMMFKQIDQNGDYFESETPISVNIAQTDIALVGALISGTSSSYPTYRISTQTPLTLIGDAEVMIESFDGGCIKSFPIHYGNELMSTSFPSSYENMKVDIGGGEITMVAFLNTVCEYQGYMPSSICQWTSSNPGVVSVDLNGDIEVDPETGNYRFFTSMIPISVGTTTITATTSIGSQTFDIEVYDSVTPVERSFLNIHEINMLYTDDLLTYQLSNVDPELVNANYSYISEDEDLAIVDFTGNVTITDVPAEDKFVYIDDEGHYKEQVYIEFYIIATAKTPTATYVDKCKVHIKGESKDIQTIQIIFRGLEENIDPGDSMDVKLVLTPYYIKDNLDFGASMRAHHVDELSGYGININPNSEYSINQTITFIASSLNDINQIIEDEFDFLGNRLYPAPVGKEVYDYGDLSESDIGDGEDHDFDPPADFNTDYEDAVWTEEFEFMIIGPPRNVYGKLNETQRISIHINKPQ